MKILVLGITGMLGNAVFRVLSNSQHHDVWGTMRNKNALGFFSESLHKKCINGVDVLDQDALIALVSKVRPDVIVNCIGLIKQLSDANNPLFAIPINTLLPHRLANLCELGGIRLVHISTDCVFSGEKGMYSEADESDAKDLYGKSKYLGEINDVAHAVTLRTSIIGHELMSQQSLVDWFLAQNGCVNGFSKAIFSGLPTVELARVINDYVLPSSNLSGLHHVSASPINKFDLLTLIAETYKKEIVINCDSDFVIDRSLDSSSFRKVTGYRPPEWDELVCLMRNNQNELSCNV